MISKLKKLWSYISHKRKRSLFSLLLLLIVSSFLDAVSIGALLPYLTILISPEKLSIQLAQFGLSSIVNFVNSTNGILSLTILMAILIVSSSMIRLFTTWFLTKTSFAIGSDLSELIYRKTLFQPYLVHVNRNSGEFIDAIHGKINVVIYQVINPLLTLISSVVILSAVFSILILINPYAAIIPMLIFGSIYAILMAFVKKSLYINSLKISNHATEVIKILQEGLGGVRDVILDKTQEIYCSK